MEPGREADRRRRHGSLLSRPNGRCLAVDSAGNVHIVWFDYRHGNPEIYYKKYDGAVWTADERLTFDGETAEYPSVAVDPDNNVHVVWTELTNSDYEIYYKVYDGMAWGPKVRLTNVRGDSRMPAIAADNAGNLHVVWYDASNSNWDVFYMKYDGAWSPDTMISTSGRADYSALPAIAVDDSFNVHVAWYDSRPGQAEIYYRKFNGSIWEPEVRLCYGMDASWSPSVAVAGGRVYVAWHDCRFPDPEIFFRAFEGGAWGAEVRVTNSNGVSANACLATDDSGYVHLVWHDDRDGSADVYYNRYNGTSWTGDLRLTTAARVSERPFIGCSSTGRLHVIWQDRRDGNYEIYYKTKDPDYLASVPRGDTVPPPGHSVKIVPNPMSSDGLIAFTLPGKADVSITIYDIAGRSVWESKIGQAAGGAHQVAWDGLDRSGRPVSPGLYFLKIEAGGQSSTAKVVVLR